MTLPNELIVQLDGKKFEDLSLIGKIIEINYCIERCEMNREEYPENRKYYNQEIKALNLLLKKL